MAQAATQSPFTARQRVDSGVPAYVLPTSAAYAAPSLEGGSKGWNRSPIAAYSTPLRDGLGSTPDQMRLKEINQYNDQPTPGRPEVEFYQGKDTDHIRRYSIEYVHADGWEEKKSRYKRGDDPRWDPVPESRPTQKMAPVSWIYTRPFDQDIKRTLNGTHFSMADHRRNYPVYGMAPVVNRRNTYRVDPTPWDTSQVDMPPNPSVINGLIRNIEVPLTTAVTNRSWRV
jgi:hypothetical protein